MPTLILHGAKKVNVDRQTSQVVAKMIPQARYVEYPDSGHGVIVTEAGAVNIDLITCLRQER